MRISPAICSLLVLLAGPAAAQMPASTSTALAPQINAADFARFDRTLSSDAFGGRKPGTQGGTRTTEFLVSEFKRMGLKPGNHGSWFQTVPAVSTQLLNPDAKLIVDAGGNTEQFSFPDQMMVQTLQGKPTVALDKSPIVFVGYGADAPAWQWNDYRDLDVKGKTVIVLVNDPGFASGNSKLFDGRAMTYYGRWTYKYAEAARQGAAACFIVHTSNDAAGYPWSVCCRIPGAARS